MKELESKHGLPEIVLYNFDEEEERDVEAVKIFTKKYSRLWRFLYNKYSNSMNYKKGADFDKLKQMYQEINIGEMRKMLDDYGFDKKNYINKDEMQTLVKLVNFKIMNKFEP